MRKNKLNDYCGQAQVWYAVRFIGEDNGIRLDSHTQIEFDDWRWEKLSALPSLVVPFKGEVYERMAERFAYLAAE